MLQSYVLFLFLMYILIPHIITAGRLLYKHRLNTENFSDGIYQDYYKKLSPARRNKTDNYHFAEDKRLSVGYPGDELKHYKSQNII